MTGVAKIVNNTTETVITARRDILINRLAITNADAATATINLYKVINGTNISIIPKDYALTVGETLLLIEGLVLMSGHSLSLATNKITHIDVNSQNDNL